MKRQITYPLTLHFKTQIYAYRFSWQCENRLVIEAVQNSQPQNHFHGELKNQRGKTADVIKSVFLHLEQIISITHKSQIDYISSTVSIIDSSKEFNRFEFKLKVKLFDKQNGEITIPLIFMLSQPHLLQKQSNRARNQMKESSNHCIVAEKQKNTDYTKQENWRASENILGKFKRIQKLIKKDERLRVQKKKQRKLLTKRRADLRQVHRLTNMLQYIQIK